MLPPDLMAALGGAGPAPQGGAPVDAQAPSAPSPGDDTAGGRTTVEILDEMIAGAQEYLSVETDEEDKLTMTKVLQQLQAYKASEQKEQDDLLAGKASPGVLRKAASGGAA